MTAEDSAGFPLVRPARETDLDPLIELTETVGQGMTSLPANREVLKRKILRTQEACEKITDEAAGEEYLFVCEDTRAGNIIGTAGLVARVGGFKPFYAFQLMEEHHTSQSLEVSNSVRYLSLLSEHDGPCELTGLLVHPDARGSGLGRLLSLSRFLYLAEYPERFDNKVIAELRGRMGTDGKPPFWVGVTRHFIPMDFGTADRLSLTNKDFISELMPDHAIYVPLLSEDARDAIGSVHSETEPARKILVREGFEPTEMVDVFDGGLILSCESKKIRAVHRSETLRISGTMDEGQGTGKFLVAGFTDGFRLTTSPLHRDAQDCQLPRKTLDILNLKEGETVRAVPFTDQNDTG